MGFKIDIGGYPYQTTDFSVQEASTPLAAGDASGQVGTITLQVVKPDPEIPGGDTKVKVIGPQALIGKSVRVSDTRKGFTLGKVVSVQEARGGGSISVTCHSRLGELNVFNIQAPPAFGTLSSVFQTYMNLAGVTTDFLVDPSIALRQVIFPGWNGDLWFHMKQMAASIDCDISLVSGIILLRPIRTRIAERGRGVDRTYTLNPTTLAQFVEVYQYNNRVITNQLVYPPSGWTPEVQTINLNAGETIAEIIQLSASVSSIQQPTMQTFVSQAHNSSSVYTIVGDDGLPIQPAQWTSFGGSLRVEINPDTTSLTVHITAPAGLPNKDGGEIGTFGVSLSADSSTGRYSTLRIIGSGVAFNKELIRVPTGVGPSETSTEVGVTIDNPFLSTRNDVYNAASRAVRAYNGTASSISGSVTAINRRGDTGEINLRTYADLQAMFPGGTYATMQANWPGQTYLQMQTSFNAGLDEEVENQVFGNISGARAWDSRSAKYYRIRTSTATPALISFDAEDDVTYSDFQTAFSGLTYQGFQNLFPGFTYKEQDLAGLRRTV